MSDPSTPLGTGPATTLGAGPDTRPPTFQHRIEYLAVMTARACPERSRGLAHHFSRQIFISH